MDWGFDSDKVKWSAATRSYMETQESLDRKRDRKWASMTRTGGLDVYCERHRTKLKQRIRKGVPQAWRRSVWPALLEVQVKKGPAAQFRSDKARVSYASLCKKSPGDIADVIERDLRRTFPQHRLFDSGEGVDSLRRLLKAYAVLDSETAYCQGMNYVAGLFIILFCAQRSVNDPMRSLGDSEEDAFWLFVAALQSPRTHLRELYGPNMIGVRKSLTVFDGLVKGALPALHAHMEKENCIPAMYATHWIVTVFAAQFPFALVARVWDMFLAEGWKPVYRVALAVLAAVEKQLRAMDFEHMLTFLRGLPETLDVPKTLSLIFTIQIPNTQVLTHLEDDAAPDDDDDAPRDSA